MVLLLKLHHKYTHILCHTCITHNIYFPQEWTQIHEQCHSSSDDLDTNMESHPSLPQKVSEVSSSDFTSPRNSSIVPASLSFQSGLTGPQSQEQVLFMNSGLHVPIDPTLPSPCTEDVEDVGRC